MTVPEKNCLSRKKLAPPSALARAPEVLLAADFFSYLEPNYQRSKKALLFQASAKANEKKLTLVGSRQ